MSLSGWLAWDQDSFLPTGLPFASCQDALDTTRVRSLGDPTAWTLTPNELSAEATSSRLVVRTLTGHDRVTAHVEEPHLGRMPIM